MSPSREIRKSSFSPLYESRADHDPSLSHVSLLVPSTKHRYKRERDEFQTQLAVTSTRLREETEAREKEKTKAERQEKVSSTPFPSLGRTNFLPPFGPF